MLDIHEDEARAMRRAARLREVRACWGVRMGVREQGKRVRASAP